MDNVKFNELDYDAAKAVKTGLEAAMRLHGDYLNNQPRYVNGLTPDSIKALPAWQDAKRKFDLAFSELGRFNKLFVKTFRVQIRQDRDAKREKLIYLTRE